MIDLNEQKSQIQKFILNSIDKFISAHGNPALVGIYCCPWAGWITINFNLTMITDGLNCPDFQFADFQSLTLPKWQEEYEGDKPQFKINERLFDYGDTSDDEELNRFIFEYLKPILEQIKHNLHLTFFLQLLDSEFEGKV